MPIIKTSSASYLHNHYPPACLPDERECKLKGVHEDVAHVHHYRNSFNVNCGQNYSSCETVIRDNRTLFYQEQLTANVQKVLRKLNIT